MNKVTTYIRESYHELLDKVTWPSWAQLQQSTAIVLVASLLIMLMVWLMDFGSKPIAATDLFTIQELIMESTTAPQQVVDTKWYVLRVVSGKERKVKEYLDKDIARSGWTEVIKQVFLPMEKSL